MRKYKNLLSIATFNQSQNLITVIALANYCPQNENESPITDQ